MKKDNQWLNSDCNISPSRSEQNGWFQPLPHLICLVHPSLSSPWIWRAAVKDGICSPYTRQSFCSLYQPVLGKSCLHVHLDLRTSGGLKLFPGMPEKGLSCAWRTWSITNGTWDQFHGEGEERNAVNMEEERVLLNAAQYPALEQQPLRVVASILQRRSRVEVISKIYSVRHINAIKHVFFLQ